MRAAQYDDFGNEFRSAIRFDPVAYPLHELNEIGGSRSAAIDDEIGVFARNLRASRACAFESRPLDEPSRLHPLSNLVIFVVNNP